MLGKYVHVLHLLHFLIQMHFLHIFMTTNEEKKNILSVSDETLFSFNV